MRSLKDILRESILDNIDTHIEKGDKLFKNEIKAFLKENYNGTFKISKKPNTDGKYEVSSTKNIRVKKNITLLTNGMFIWTIIGGSFYCYDCPSLKSLEGAPKEVGGDFECWGSKSLESLKGAPKEVGGDFHCYGCKVKFTEDDVKKVSNVKGKIVC